MKRFLRKKLQTVTLTLLLSFFSFQSLAMESSCPDDLLDRHQAGGDGGYASCLPPNDSLVICPSWSNANPHDLSMCRSVKNNTKMAFFVPWNTEAEWNAFVANYPSDDITVSKLGRVCDKASYEIEICQGKTVFWNPGLKTMGTRLGTQTVGYGAEGETRTYDHLDQDGNYDPVNGEFTVTVACKYDESAGEMNWVQVSASGACTPAACAKTRSYAVDGEFYDIHQLFWGLWAPNQEIPIYDQYLCDAGNYVSPTDFKPGAAWLWHWTCHGTKNTTAFCSAQYGSWAMSNSCGYKAVGYDSNGNEYAGTISNPVQTNVGEDLNYYFHCNENAVGDDTTSAPTTSQIPYPGCGMGVRDAHRYLCNRWRAANFNTTYTADGHALWSWDCPGINGGSGVTGCAALSNSASEDGHCGIADGGSSTVAPTDVSSMCSSGWGGHAAVPVCDTTYWTECSDTKNNLGWNWLCSGKNSGSSALCHGYRVLACKDSVSSYTKTVSFGPTAIDIRLSDGTNCPANVTATLTPDGGSMTQSSQGQLTYSSTKYTFTLPIALPSLENVITQKSAPYYETPCYVAPNYLTTSVQYKVQGTGTCPKDYKLNDHTTFTLP